MIKRGWLIFLMVCELHAKHPENILTMPLHVRVASVKDDLNNAYETELIRVMDYHEGITNDIREGILDSEDYDMILEYDIHTFADSCLQRLRNIAHQKTTQKVPYAPDYVVEEIDEHVEALYDQLSYYIFVFSPVAMQL